MQGLVRDLQSVTKRKTPQEERAWKESLPSVSDAFSHPSFSDLHLYFGTQGVLSLEYKLPASACWADMVLLGQHNKRPAAVIVELKNWMTAGDKPGTYQGLMFRQGASAQHPSDQVSGYTEYIKQFHSAVHEANADVHGCVLFTRDKNYHTYQLIPNADLTQQYPCFSTKRDQDTDRLLEYFKERLTAPNREFAEKFEEGTYVQNRGFVAQIGRQVLDANDSPFVLLDNQRFAFAEVNAAVERSVLDRKRPKKTVIIVKGPPGSGKSVVAAKVWASLVTNEKLKDGNVVVTTTSTAQRSNWEHLFKLAGGHGSSGVTISANTYTPATTGVFGSLRKQYPDAFKKEPEWRYNVEMLNSLLGEFRSGSRDNEYLVSIVDEAHALINPEHVDGRGQFGFATAFGPQAYHIMRASTITVFLLDEQQGFRDRENTTIDDIRLWAQELGVKSIEEIDLSGSQFRCAGSIEYIRWVDRTLSLNVHDGLDNRNEGVLLKAAEPTVVYGSNDRLLTNRFDPFKFAVYDSIHEMERQLRSHHDAGESVRLLASYSRPWATQNRAMPHHVDADEMDFYFPPDKNGKSWSRVWNHTPKGDYSLFVQARAGYPMFDDPLCEVGCPYTVRGFDFDYVGLLWLSDLVNRDGVWIVNPEHVHETGLTPSLGRLKKAVTQDGPAYTSLLKSVQQYYRILMTRSVKGLYVWCEDQETREWLRRTELV
jgi:DUF2075 family protein